LDAHGNRDGAGVFGQRSKGSTVVALRGGKVGKYRSLMCATLDLHAHSLLRLLPAGHQPSSGAANCVNEMHGADTASCSGVFWHFSHETATGPSTKLPAKQQGDLDYLTNARSSGVLWAMEVNALVLDD
jgi:hypothetical protein